MEANLSIATNKGVPVALVVKFTGPDGRLVTLGFDTRGEVSLKSGDYVCTEYSALNDCPVIADVAGIAGADGRREYPTVLGLPAVLATLVDPVVPEPTGIAKYAVRSCCGDLLEYVTVDALPDFEDEPDYSVRYDAMVKAGYDPGAKCGGCYDNSYNAEFVGWVNSHL